MRYTTSAIGLLTRQYRSVLKKCFLINLGLFALGVMSANPALADLVYTITQGTASDYSYTTIENGVTKYWKIALNTSAMSTSNSIVWTKVGSSEKDFSFNGTTGSGIISVALPHNGSTQTNYYTYTYTKPSGYTSSSRLSNLTSNVSNKYFYNLSSSNNTTASSNKAESFGGSLSNQNSNRSIVADFISNSVSAYVNFSTSADMAPVANSYAYGGAIYNKGSGISITGNFINNSASATAYADNTRYSYDEIIDDAEEGARAFGGAIYNAGTITSISGDFIKNKTSATSGSFATYGFSDRKGGAIYNTGTITGISGDFIGNSSDKGGAIYNQGTIGSITGNFIGNSAGYGGAIFNGTYPVSWSDLWYNSARPTYNSNAVITLAGNVFANNGKSIYNAGVINIANGKTVTIHDGYDGLSQAQLKIGSAANSGAVFNLSVDNGTLQTDNLGTVTNNGTINWDLDVSLTAKNSDKITINSLSGTQSIIINTINLMTGTGDAQVDVTLTTNSTLKAALKLSDTFSIANNITRAAGVTYTVNNVTYNKVTGKLTFNGVTDALLTANTTSGTRSFGNPELSTASSVHTLTADLTGTAVGDFTINGTKSGTGSSATRATIDLNSHKGFDLANATTLSINNTKVTNGANGVAITVSNANAKVNLDGAYIDGKITATKNYTLTTKGETVLNANVTTGTLAVTSGELKNNGVSTVGGGSNAGTISGTGSLSNTGVFENKSGATISQSVSHSGTGANIFTNNGTISGAVTNSGVFVNNNTISGDVTNTGTMTSDITNLTGAITNNGSGTLNLSGDLSKDIAGSGTTVLQSDTATVAANRTIAGTLNLNGKTLGMNDSSAETLTVGKLTGNGNLTLNINAQTGAADEIHINNTGSNSVLTVTSLNLTKPTVTAAEDHKEYTKQILTGNSAGASLALSSDVTSAYTSTSISRTGTDNLGTDTIDWDENYGGWVQNGTQTETVSVVSSSDELQDSIKYELNKVWGDKNFTDKAENLALINQYTATSRTMNFDGIHEDETAQGVYTVASGLGTTAAGTLTLNGVKSGENNTTLNLNGNAFDLSNASTLELNNIDLTGNTTPISVSNADVDITLSNSTVNGNIAATTAYDLTTDGTSQINGTVAKARLVNEGELTTTAGNIADATSVTNNSTLNLSGDLAQEIKGTGGTTKVNTSLSLNDGASIAGTLDLNSGAVTISNSAHNIGKLTGTADATISANATTGAISSLDIQNSGSDGVLNIKTFNFDKTGLVEGTDYNQTMQVLTGEIGDAKINLDATIAAAHTGSKISDINGATTVTSDSVAWSDKFGAWTQSRTENESLTATDTALVYTVSHEYGEKVYSEEGAKEGLKQLNTRVSENEKHFDAETSGKEHKIIEDLGTTVGKLLIDGKGGTLNFDGHTGFVMASGTEVSLKDVTAKDADGLADVKNGATLNLESVTLENNGLLQNAGTINLSGSNSIDSVIAGTGTSATLNVNSDWDMDTRVTDHKINVNGAKLTVNAGNLVASDSLTAKFNSEIDIATNKVNLDQMAFESGSKLSLRVDSLANYGSIEANNITVEEGATLSATLAQGIVKIGQKETVQLLAANNENFNNFADSFDNAMYHFEKSGNNGAYLISQVKTAEEVAEEIGGTETAAQAAAAWVDGDTFDAGTVGADIADKLSDLAQNDATGLVKAVEALAPTETAVVEENATENSSRLFKNVDAYLRRDRDPLGFVSGDELKGVSIWAKAYIGEAKINNRGKIAGSESDSRGVIMGVEKKLDKNKKVGIGFQYDDTDIDALSRDIDVATLNGFVYGEYKPNRWFINSVAAYGQSDYKEKKFALGSKYTADYDVHIASLAAMTGYQFKYFTPEAGMRYYHIKQDGYTDSAGQSVGAINTDILRAVFGTRVARDFGRIRPEAYFGVTYDLMAGEHDTTVNLANGTSYTVPGRRLARLGYEASISVAASITDSITASLAYLGAYRRDYQEHTGMFNVKYNF